MKRGNGEDGRFRAMRGARLQHAARRHGGVAVEFVIRRQPVDESLNDLRRLQAREDAVFGGGQQRAEAVSVSGGDHARGDFIRATRAAGVLAPTAPQLSCRPFCRRKPAEPAFCPSQLEKEIVALLARQNRKYLLIFRGLLRLHRISFYLTAPVEGAFCGDRFPPRPATHPGADAPEDWLVAIATALLAFVLLGILPRLFW